MLHSPFEVSKVHSNPVHSLQVCLVYVCVCVCLSVCLYICLFVSMCVGMRACACVCGGGHVTALGIPGHHRLTV